MRIICSNELNNIICSITFSSKYCKITIPVLYEKLNILKLADIYNLELPVAKYMHQLHYNKLPFSLYI